MGLFFSRKAREERKNRGKQIDLEGEVCLDHFEILRSIGRGSFGKVCIVQRKDTKQLYALKYMCKQKCSSDGAIANVLKELQILQSINHSFVVNLWYAFQDHEDMFMVLDLMLGGDIRFHLNEGKRFTEQQVILYLAEVGLALDYLHSLQIVHRDIKPDNLLLDDKGHIHITDFNIATVLQENCLATSLSGTKAYMAPEIFATYINKAEGYSFEIDWWSLGITVCEMVRGKFGNDCNQYFIGRKAESEQMKEIIKHKLFDRVSLEQAYHHRPFAIHSDTDASEAYKVFLSELVLELPCSMSDGVVRLIKKLLQPDPKRRLHKVTELKSHVSMESIDFNEVAAKEIIMSFIPSRDHLNCDPTYELEEMIIESKPLHKKKKRLHKQLSKKMTSSESELANTSTPTTDTHDQQAKDVFAGFAIFDRTLARKEELSNRAPEEVKAR